MKRYVFIISEIWKKFGQIQKVVWFRNQKDQWDDVFKIYTLDFFLYTLRYEKKKKITIILQCKLCYNEWKEIMFPPLKKKRSKFSRNNLQSYLSYDK